MRAKAVLNLALPLLATGCFSYQPARIESIAPGSAVRVRISPEEAERLAAQGLSEDRLVGGKLVSNGDQTLLLDTPVSTADPTRGTRALTQRVSIPLGEVREVELRQLDWTKTAIVGGGVTAVVGFVIARQIAGGSGRDDGPGGEVPDLRPVLRLRVPLGW